MPEIVRFYGIIIKMFFGDHPPPREYNALFTIEPIQMLEGDLPKRAENMVSEWASMYKSDLLNIWNTQEFRKLPPLK